MRVKNLGDTSDRFDTSEKAIGRRETLRRALKLGGLAYAAPMIVGAVASVSAQASGFNPACVGATCLNTSNCFSQQNCFCFTLANGTGFCGTGASCGVACSLASPCGAGFVCQVNTCCGASGVCIPASTACSPVGNAPAPDLGDGRSTNTP